VTAHIACVIPAYDAAATVPAVVAGLRASLPHATIVGVDDGSRDDTGAVLASLCDAGRSHPVNRGKGAALRSGIEVALELGATAVVTIDADGQHDPAHAPALLAALSQADLVIGARRRAGTAMPAARRLTNSLSTAVVSYCAGRAVDDSQSGYRALRAELLATVRPEGDRYEFETSLLILAARSGFRITSVPVTTLYGPPSHFRHVRDTLRVARTLWRHRPGTRR
jgi:glycosyltransferase involved in cell wall biosynthesis